MCELYERVSTARSLLERRIGRGTLADQQWWVAEAPSSIAGRVPTKASRWDAAPADAQRTSLGGGLPLSKLLEPRAPMLASFSMEIDAPPRSDAIRVHVAPTFEVAPPGDGAGAKVRWHVLNAETSLLRPCRRRR